MLRKASGRVLKPSQSLSPNVQRHSRRWIQTNATAKGFQYRSSGRNAAVAVSAALLGSYMVYSSGRKVYNDVYIPANGETRDPTFGPASQVLDEDNLHTLVWGSNRTKLLSPNAKSNDTVRTPAVASWLDGVALRDLQLHENYAACIDANGDVYQWGEGFYGDLLPQSADRGPRRTLTGKNIIQLQLTDDKVYALSASGQIYVFAAKAKDQPKPVGAPIPSSDSWWGTGWLWGEDQTIDFAQLTPNDKLNRREKFTSIAAGQNHLLALTSKGRTFGHPINKLANAYGQLGFQSFSVPDPAALLTGTNTHLHVDLVPKSLHDPYMKASRSMRVTIDAEPDVQQDLGGLNDKSVRFCPFIYEIPVLQGIQIAQVAAGARSSFARTPSGRVLGWGANEYGQLGLGANVALDTITVPTEVILWRATPNSVESTCTDVKAGGDLTAFVVDRAKDQEATQTELLMTGNGQYGGLGNNVFTTGQRDASRVKAVSGLRQYNEKTNTLDPIKPEEITVAPFGHVLLTINSSADSNGVGGSDVMVWGRNFDSELGNGRKSSIAGPIHLDLAEGERLMLRTRKAKEVKDLHGKVWKKGVNVKQQVAAGYGTSVVYWKIDQ
ncbi:regulator of chromosome condensation 1/beta-lactamase-inhibitor protein II [Ephemerocybe angulata]|uniref:Regulator of chromosome condensation 1/beta-lactamase-inhibitor protein II n=1 Tax=Ephemerocybe angulata TaxID=980116 RepID=A0A8H6IIZ5_9AGAR|nr:regulator of chromosome condensation 1/beta-lactamase-inhibitor protein II [Tulosesus angulatus]